VAHALSRQLGGRHAIPLAVIALAQPGVSDDGDARPVERDLGGLDGAPKIRREDDGDPIVTATLAKLPGESAPTGGQTPIEPSGRYAALVVLSQGVCLVDDVDAHARAPSMPGGGFSLG
jgi:hypothetical protein